MDDPKPCRHCGGDLLTEVDRVLGIHVWCIREIESRVTIPQPGYSVQKREEQPSQPELP